MGWDCMKCDHYKTPDCFRCSTHLQECTCHINPPCSACENSFFEDARPLKFISSDELRKLNNKTINGYLQARLLKDPDAQLSLQAIILLNTTQWELDSTTVSMLKKNTPVHSLPIGCAPKQEEV